MLAPLFEVFGNQHCCFQDLPSTKRLFYKHHIYSPLMDEINPFAYEGLDEGTPDFPWVPPSLDWVSEVWLFHGVAG